MDTNKVQNVPSLGDVALERNGSGTWTVRRAGAVIAEGLSFADVLAIIRGELAVADLEKEQGDVH